MRGIVIKRIEREIVTIPLGIFVFKFAEKDKERSLSFPINLKTKMPGDGNDLPFNSV